MRSNLDFQMFVCACACGSVCACSCVYVCAQANGKTWPISIVGVGLWRKRKTAIRFMPTIGNTIIKIILRVLTGMLTNSPIQHYKEPPSPPTRPHSMQDKSREGWKRWMKERRFNLFFAPLRKQRKVPKLQIYMHVYIWINENLKFRHWTSLSSCWGHSGSGVPGVSLATC